MKTGWTLTALLISAVAILIASLLYYRKPLQLALRVIAIILIYLLVTNFTLRVRKELPQDDPIVVIDHSMSMKNHLDKISKIVATVDGPIDIYFAQESLLTKQQPTELGRYTDLAGTINRAGEFKPALIVLITDGNYNAGISPVSSAEDLGIPIHVYGVGEEMPRDIVISEVNYPEYAHTGDSIRIDAVIETGGFQTGTCEVVLQSAEGNDIATRSVPLSNVTAENNVVFTYAAAEPGTLQLKIKAGPEAKEASYDNNEYAFHLTVLEEKIAVLYYTEHVSFTTKFVLRALSEDPDVTVSAIARLGADDFRSIEAGKKLTSLPDLEDYDVLIFDNVNVESIPWHDIPGSVAYGKGMVLMGTVDGINSSWQKIMPINIAAGILQGTYRLDIAEPFSVLTADNNPPFKNMDRIIAANEDAVIIARTGDLPVIGYRMHGHGMVFQLCIVDMGSWYFLRTGVTAQGFLQTLLGDVVRFLSPSGQQDRLVLKTKNRNCMIGANADMQLQSYDRNFRRVGGGDFYLVTGASKIPFYETQTGYYEALLPARDTGRIRIQAQGVLHGEYLTSNTLQINVLTRSVENEHRINRVLLQSIAAASNGEFHALDDLRNIVIPEIPSKKTVRVMSIDSPITYLLVLALLLADWILRRRRGIT
jgi:hypothetical protein